MLRSSQKFGHLGRLTSKVALYQSLLASVPRTAPSVLARVSLKFKIRKLQHIPQSSLAHETNVVVLQVDKPEMLEILERTR